MADDELVMRVRAICSQWPGVMERPSHGAPTWFVAGNGARFFRPPYVGHRGWVGARLAAHLEE